MPDSARTPVTRRWPFLAGTAAAFALLMTVGPIIATQGVDAGGSDRIYSGYNVGMIAARSYASATDGSIGPRATPGGPPESPILAVAPIIAEPTAVIPEEPAPSIAVAPIVDPKIGISMALADQDLADGGTARWEITVTNRSGEYLWGVYVYLEGFGKVECGSRQLDVDVATTCFADQPVWQGDHLGIAWVTAWSTDEMMESKTFRAFDVGA
jgi:hypothetical protein